MRQERCQAGQGQGQGPTRHASVNGAAVAAPEDAGPLLPGGPLSGPLSKRLGPVCYCVAYPRPSRELCGFCSKTTKRACGSWSWSGVLATPPCSKKRKILVFFALYGHRIDDLRTIAEKYGPLKDIYLPKDYYTG